MRQLSQPLYLEKRLYIQNVNVIKNMKVNELRIGNYVMYEPTIDDWEEKVITLHSLLQVDISPESYCGIPLTEEWLLKFGFDETIVEGYPLYQSNKGFIVEYYVDESVFLILDFEVRVKHVHQLQNLYFALTGKELELT